MRFQIRSVLRFLLLIVLLSASSSLCWAQHDIKRPLISLSDKEQTYKSQGWTLTERPFFPHEMEMKILGVTYSKGGRDEQVAFSQTKDLRFRWIVPTERKQPQSSDSISMWSEGLGGVEFKKADGKSFTLTTLKSPVEVSLSEWVDENNRKLLVTQLVGEVFDDNKVSMRFYFSSSANVVFERTRKR